MFNLSYLEKTAAFVAAAAKTRMASMLSQHTSITDSVMAEVNKLKTLIPDFAKLPVDQQAALIAQWIQMAYTILQALHSAGVLATPPDSISPVTPIQPVQPVQPQPPAS